MEADEARARRDLFVLDRAAARRRPCGPRCDCRNGSFCALCHLHANRRGHLADRIYRLAARHDVHVGRAAALPRRNWRVSRADLRRDEGTTALRGVADHRRRLMDPQYAAAYPNLYRHHWWWRVREQILLEKIRRILGRVRNPRILDVGCGAGLFFDALQPFGHVEGIEADL